MRLLTKLITGGGIAAFFFFSWVLMMLWNAIIANHLQILPALSYLQAAGLWFLSILLFAWVGIAGAQGLKIWRSTADWESIGDKLERRLRSAFGSQRRPEADWHDVAETIEDRVRRGFARFADADPDVEWDELEDTIEEKIERIVRQWTNEV